MNPSKQKFILLITFVMSLFYITLGQATPWHYGILINKTNFVLNLKKTGQHCVHNGKYSVPNTLNPGQKVLIKYDEDHAACTAGKDGYPNLSFSVSAAKRGPCKIKMERSTFKLSNCGNAGYKFSTSISEEGYTQLTLANWPLNQP